MPSQQSSTLLDANKIKASKLDLKAIRSMFPAAEKLTYLDSGFQTPLSVPIRAAIDRYLDEGFAAAGPKSVWIDRLEAARRKVARLLGVEPENIAFTKNTSECMNIAANALPLEPGDNLLLIEGDHPNNAYAFLNLQRKGVEVRFVPARGHVNADTFRPYVDGRTRAISMSHVTFHAGALFDVQSVGRYCSERDIYFVLDSMQAVGVVPIDAKATKATFLGFGTHKGLLTPQGFGVLYWNRKHSELEPAYLATASIENPPADLIASSETAVPASTARRFEIGNFNLLGAGALAAALDLLEDVGVPNIEEHCYALGDHLINGLDQLGIGLVGPRKREKRAPHIYVAALLPASEWVEYLEDSGIRVSPERDGIRISFGMFNIVDDVDVFLAAVRDRLTP